MNNTGGPAFPLHNRADAIGMTLRDYFAAKALLMLGSLHANSNLRYSPEGGALKAYEIADAMLAARDAKP